MGEFDTPNDPMCGKPWADHSRIGDCPRDPADRRSMFWLGVAFIAALALFGAYLLLNSNY